jgi:hypothetical protein
MSSFFGTLTGMHALSSDCLFKADIFIEAGFDRRLIPLARYDLKFIKQSINSIGFAIAEAGKDSA